MQAADEAVNMRAVDEPGTAWTGHVIVCGLNGLGLSIVEQLHFSGVEVVVVDDHPERRLVAVLEGWSVAHVAGSPRDLGVLVSAGAHGARAVICVEDDDLHTLETALLAQGLRSDLRVVVRMANAAVARAVGEVIGAGSALDVADLAAPSLVQACIGRRDHDVDIDGQRFTTREVTSERDGTLRDLYGDLVPIAVVAVGGRSVNVCPGRDQPVARGDRVIVLGAGRELGRLPGPVPDRRAKRERPRAIVGDLTRRVWRGSGLGFRLAFAALVGLVVVATVAIRLGYRQPTGSHLGTLTSLYFTVETVATVGFGDFSFANQSTWLKVFGILLIIVGAGLVTTMFALLTNVLVSRSVANAIGGRRAVRMLDHVVVVGLGAIGLRVVERLVEQGRQVAIIERDPNNRHLDEARSLRVPVVIGDATLAATLDSANVGAASAVAVLTSDDLTNLETSLSLRDYLGGTREDDVSERLAGPTRSAPPIVLRIFDRSLAQTVDRNFGFHFVRSTSALAAPWFVGAATGLEVLLTFYVEQERLLVARLTVAPAGGLAGLAMQDLSARIRVIAIRRSLDGGRLEHPPRRNTRFAPGDRAYLIGPYEELLTVLRRDAISPQGATST